jgi:hypothetical protein
VAHRTSSDDEEGPKLCLNVIESVKVEANSPETRAIAKMTPRFEMKFFVVFMLVWLIDVSEI